MIHREHMQVKLLEQVVSIISKSDTHIHYYRL